MMTTMLHGFLMALADSIPGVSGGTIAFILGYYERLLGALHGFFGKDRAQRGSAFRYLVKFALGWGVGMGASVLLLAQFFERNIYFMSSLFLGLTACALPFIAYEERDALKENWHNGVYALLGAAVVILMTAVRAGTVGAGSVDFRSLGAVQYGYLVISGILAISAMLLPGISGSSLLLILGVYVPLIGAVKEVLHLHLQYLPGVLAVAGGVVLGVVLTSGLIRRALAKYRSQMIYFVLGLMAGSLYAILMGPTTLTVPKPALSFSTFQGFAFVIGAGVLCGLELAKRRMTRTGGTVGG